MGKRVKAASRRRAAGGGKKFRKVMGEFGHHTLHSGSKRGPVVTNPKQAAAIAFSEERRAATRHPKPRRVPAKPKHVRAPRRGHR
jgi:hypothetical protein